MGQPPSTGDSPGARRDRSIRAVILTGARDGVSVTHYEIEEILAGAEGVGPPAPRPAAAALVTVVGGVKHVPGVRGLVERTPVRGLLELHRIHDLFRRMNRSDKIYIAAINGSATGGGCELALASDLRYMADDDSLRIGLPEMTIGLPPGAGGSQRLARALGSSWALEMMLEGRTLTPAEAHSSGLVHGLAPANSLRAAATKAARCLARRSPEAVRAEALRLRRQRRRLREGPRERAQAVLLGGRGEASAPRDAGLHRGDQKGRGVAVGRCREARSLAARRGGRPRVASVELT